jgi:hypothetical protein
MSAQEVFLDPATGVAIVSDISPEEVEPSFNAPQFAGLDNRIHRALASWAEDIHPAQRSSRGVFQRDKFVTSPRVLDQIKMAYEAANDDIIGNVLDTSESLAFQKIHFQSEDEDQEDVWNQIGRDLDLDGFLRTAHRELSIASQFYGVRQWGTKEYTVRGKGEKGRNRRKSFTLTVPTALGFLDPLRVIPVGMDYLGRGKLAWAATGSEMEAMKDLAPDGDQLFVGKYEPKPSEAQMLQDEEIATENLIELNPKMVFRHTLTKSSYERWAAVRMSSVFALLDLKHQLREMDRVWLLGGINFVVLVTRGTDTRPATAPEVEATASQVRAASKSPIIVTDHRITMSIISPDVEHVLNTEKWNVLDERIMMRAWGTFSMSSNSGGRETSLTLGKVIASGLGSRRHMLKRMVEKDIVKAVQDEPTNTEFTSKTKLEYSPRRVELAFDSDIITLIQELRDRGDLSRQTTLEEFMFDQKLEAQRREREDGEYGDIFKPVNVPFDSPDKTTPGGSGRKTPRPAKPTNPEGNDGQ